MNPVDDVSGEGRGGDLHGFRGQARDVVEEPFPPAEKHWDDVKHQLAETACPQCLLDSACTASHVNRLIARYLGGCGQCTVEAVHKVEDGTALHLDRVVRIVGQYEHGGVIRGLRAPPAAPIGLAPLTTHRPEHVATHDVRAAGAKKPSSERFVDRVLRIIEVPVMQRSPIDAKRIVLALVGASDEPVERDAHVASNERHGAATSLVRAEKRNLSAYGRLWLGGTERTDTGRWLPNAAHRASARGDSCPRILESMTRSESGRPTPPRLPPDLSSEPNLRLIAGSEVNHATIQGDFSGGDLEGLQVEDSRIVGSSFTAADFNRLRLIDVVVEGSDLSGADMAEASFTRVTFSDCRMSGALLPRAKMQDVTFSEVKLDQVNFRMIEGQRVVFDHVNLERTEFYSAHVKAACFFDCNLNGSDVSQVKLPGARFHGSVLSDIKGGEYLRDVVIETPQVLPLAHGVFAGLNIRVEDDRDADLRPMDREDSSNPRKRRA
jgi:uncharacterized protein YjbI with pentapeptide repeats